MSHQWIWGRSDTPPKNALSRWEKQALLAKAEELLCTFHRPQFVRPVPAGHQFNHVTDFSSRWNGAYLLFTAKYACPGPSALASFFTVNFARIGWFHLGRCNVWGRRHNDQWFVVADDLTFEGCLEELRTNPWFHF